MKREIQTETNRMYAADERKEMLTLAVDIGARMLKCGAEIFRVEDSISRILTAAGADEVDVFSIISGIVVTAFWNGVPETQTRRIHETGHNMAQLAALNELSRNLCTGRLSIAQGREKLAAIERMPVYGHTAECGIYALISCAFSVFFGGNALDALLSAAIGALICVLQRALRSRRITGIMNVLILSVLGGIAAHGAHALGLACSPQHIAIGNIMLLVPGISLTNAIRDMFSGDTISGSLRFVESILFSLTLAWGFALPALLF